MWETYTPIRHGNNRFVHFSESRHTWNSILLQMQFINLFHHSKLCYFRIQGCSSNSCHCVCRAYLKGSNNCPEWFPGGCSHCILNDCSSCFGWLDHSCTKTNCRSIAITWSIMVFLIIAINIGFTFVTKVTYALIKSDTNTLLCDLCLKVNLTASFQLYFTRIQRVKKCSSNNKRGRTFNSEATSTVETCINSIIT